MSLLPSKDDASEAYPSPPPAASAPQSEAAGRNVRQRQHFLPAECLFSSWLKVPVWRDEGTLGTNSICDACNHYDLRRTSAGELQRLKADAGRTHAPGQKS